MPSVPMSVVYEIPIIDVCHKNTYLEEKKKKKWLQESRLIISRIATLYDWIDHDAKNSPSSALRKQDM